MSRNHLFAPADFDDPQGGHLFDPHEFRDPQAGQLHPWLPDEVMSEDQFRSAVGGSWEVE